jgi:hypothetical protein
MNSFTINDYRFVLPFQSETLKYAAAADGGTLWISIDDSSGIHHDFYIDRRLKTETRDHIYLQAPPSSQGSKYLGEATFIVSEVEAIIGKANAA